MTPPTGSVPAAPAEAAPTPATPPAPQQALPQTPPAPPPAAALPQPGGQITSGAPPRDLSNEPDLIELVIEPRSVLILQAEASNEDAFPALVAALNRLGEEARKAGVVITGRPFAVIDLTDDKTFKFQAMLPVENTATTPPIPGLRFGQSPSGQAIRFKYAGAYEDNTYVYESIEAYIEERDIKARPYAIEEFLTDPKDANDASLQMFIYYLRE
ncbi:MAG: GyrI-like domain-containing protein [Beijerinckiaceae bacterium]|nr:GyrI-like domain-containing protein [Beijerinckiaceae bacterium]